MCVLRWPTTRRSIVVLQVGQGRPVRRKTLSLSRLVPMRGLVRRGKEKVSGHPQMNQQRPPPVQPQQQELRAAPHGHNAPPTEPLPKRRHPRPRHGLGPAHGNRHNPTPNKSTITQPGGYSLYFR